MTYKTEGKQKILELFCNNSNRSFTVSDVYLELKDSGVGKSTVYRIISEYEKSGVITRVPVLGKDGERYRFTEQGSCLEHLHLKCRECGKLMHLDKATSGAISENLLSKAGFSLDGAAILSGKCSECSIINGGSRK
jgi:Fur family ferric uptake transcriptional regulator